MTAWHLLGLLTLCHAPGLAVPLFSRRDAARTNTDAKESLHRAVRFSLVCALLGSLAAMGFGAAVAFGWMHALPLTPWTIGEFDLGFALKSGQPARLTVALALQLDGLGAFFLLLIGGFSALVAIYSIGALKAVHFNHHRHRIVAAFNAFVWSTLLVVLVADGLLLLVALELMSLSFGYLALFKHLMFESDKQLGRDATAAHQEHKEHNARLAPQVYVMASHASTAFLMVAVGLLGLHAGGFEFSTLAAPAKPLDPWTASVVFLLALAGLGIRVGLVPAHVWVPLVHPQSPTPTHALSLGIAIKVGVYLMLRFFFQFLEPQSWWGYLLLSVAALTALVNVWYAIASHDLKEALAYHSIENIGIMTAGIGLALIFAPIGTDAARWSAALALIAGLYHLLNHAAFKGLLYMAVGSVDNRTRQVEIARLGGLIHHYPWTAAAFIVGAFAISGFPPLNGFIGEWLTLQALYLGIAQGSALQMPVLVAALALLVASFALTAFCFYKLVGLAFLGQRRPARPADLPWLEGDSPWWMLGPMVFMAVLCLMLGLAPGLVAPWIGGLVIDANLVPKAPDLACLDWSGLSLWGLDPQWRFGQVPTPRLPIIAVVVTGGLLMIGLWALRRRGPARKPTDQVWNCGTPFDAATMQYTGAAVSELVRRVRRETPHPRDLEPSQARPTAAAQPTGHPGTDEKARTERVELDEWLRISESRRYPQWTHEVFRAGYNSLSSVLYGGSEWLAKRVQGGDIRQYLGYIWVTQLAILLLFLLLPGDSHG